MSSIRINSFFYVAVFMFLSAGGYAVDGYKDIKFGISIDQLERLKVCNLSNDPTQSTQFLKVYVCPDFKFNSSKTYAGFHFVDGKLLRMGINLGTEKDEFITVLNALSEKYGKPTLTSPMSYIDEFVVGKRDKVDFGWDGETVILRMFRNDAEKNVMVIYTSSSYDSEVMKLKTKSMKNDL